MPDQVVEAALRDFRVGKVVSVPGFVDKVAAGGASVLPDSVLRRLMAMVDGYEAGSSR